MVKIVIALARQSVHRCCALDMFQLSQVRGRLVEAELLNCGITLPSSSETSLSTDCYLHI